MQELPARQRAVLILRDVVQFSAAEVAELLETTPAAVNSALQRARTHLAEAAPTEDDVADPDDAALRSLLDRYCAAFENGDIAALTELLRADVKLEMPPHPVWFDGRDAVTRFLAARAFSAPGDVAMVPTTANAQPAVADYRRGADGVLCGPCAARVDGPRRWDRGDHRLPRSRAVRGVRFATDVPSDRPPFSLTIVIDRCQPNVLGFWRAFADILARHPRPWRRPRDAAPRDAARLFDAAVAEIDRSGMAGADISAIAHAAGVARGTFYFHFPTKEHVLVELERDEEAGSSQAGRRNEFADLARCCRSWFTTSSPRSNGWARSSFATCWGCIFRRPGRRRRTVRAPAGRVRDRGDHRSASAGTGSAGARRRRTRGDLHDRAVRLAGDHPVDRRADRGVDRYVTTIV